MTEILNAGVKNPHGGRSIYRKAKPKEENCWSMESQRVGEPCGSKGFSFDVKKYRN